MDAPMLCVFRSREKNLARRSRAQSFEGGKLRRRQNSGEKHTAAAEANPNYRAGSLSDTALTVYRRCCRRLQQVAGIINLDRARGRSKVNQDGPVKRTLGGVYGRTKHCLAANEAKVRYDAGDSGSDARGRSCRVGSAILHLGNFY